MSLSIHTATVREDAENVTEGHVNAALLQTEINRFQKLISGQTPHVKHIHRVLALLTEQNDQQKFRTADIYDTYKKITKQAETKPLSYDRVQRLLKEQSFLGITETKHTGGGHKERSYGVHQLLRTPEIVVEALDRH